MDDNRHFPVRNPRDRWLAAIALHVGLVLGLARLCGAVDVPASSGTRKPSATNTLPREVSVTREQLTGAIDRGLAYLLKNQNSNSWWSTGEQPAVTALVLTAFNQEPSGRFLHDRPSELNRAYDFVLTSAQPDGSIHRGKLFNYNTALCLVALSTADDPNFLPVIRAARQYLAGSQIDLGEKGQMDTPFDGGVGYGSKYQHSDMNNTLTAIEAMRVSERILQRDVSPSAPKDPDLNWAAVARFLQNCQNLPSHNSAAWVSDDPKDQGGFVYYPGQSMAGGSTNPVTGKIALRSYGSISYAGLLSYVYARVDQDDPRVKAVTQWLTSNYTLEENPGMGQQGYYYYLHLMIKALRAARIDTLQMASGQDVNWRQDAIERLLKLQQPDGSWINQEPRWWETDKNLVTSYVLMSLEILYQTVPPAA